MKNDLFVAHIAQVTAGAMMSPQNRFRQNSSGEYERPLGAIIVPGKYDNLYWALSILLLLAAATMGWWLPLLQRLLG